MSLCSGLTVVNMANYSVDGGILYEVRASALELVSGGSTHSKLRGIHLAFSSEILDGE